MEGDVADVGGGAFGVVESVGLRVTTIRAFNGQLWYAHNGQSAIPFPRQVMYHRQEYETAPLRVQSGTAAKDDGAARPGRSPTSAL